MQQQELEDRISELENILIQFIEAFDEVEGEAVLIADPEEVAVLLEDANIVLAGGTD